MGTTSIWTVLFPLCPEDTGPASQSVPGGHGARISVCARRTRRPHLIGRAFRPSSTSPALTGGAPPPCPTRTCSATSSPPRRRSLPESHAEDPVPAAGSAARPDVSPCRGDHGLGAGQVATGRCPGCGAERGRAGVGRGGRDPRRRSAPCVRWSLLGGGRPGREPDSAAGRPLDGPRAGGGFLRGFPVALPGKRSGPRLLPGARSPQDGRRFLGGRVSRGCRAALLPRGRRRCDGRGRWGGRRRAGRGR